MKKYKNKIPNVSVKTYVAESADIVGDVIIGDNSSIWFGAVLRGDINKITIGSSSNIQDNCTVHVGYESDTWIGDFVTVGHNAVIHGCTIGNNVVIGMGSIILNNAEIGEYSIIGAGSLVTLNKKFPPGVLIMGSPAKVIRELSQEEKDRIKESADHYVKASNEYKE